MHAVYTLGRMTAPSWMTPSLEAAPRHPMMRDRSRVRGPVRNRFVRALEGLGACGPITRAVCEAPLANGDHGQYQADGSCVFPDGSTIGPTQNIFDGNLQTGGCGTGMTCAAPATFVMGTGPQWQGIVAPGLCVPPEGLHFASGAVLGQDGTYVLADGSSVAEDGTWTSPSGTVVDPDGTVHPSVSDSLTDLAKAPAEALAALNDLGASLKGAAKQTASTLNMVAWAAIAVAAAYVVHELGGLGGLLPTAGRRRRR